MADERHHSQLTHDQISRINKRAKKLAQAAYEEYRSRMMQDPLVTTGHTRPENWCPIEATEDVLELIRATATSLAATSRSLDRRADQLAQLSLKMD
ncbi:MAG: hypothetical protein Q8O62_13310 [Aequorivita sp.]|nr:hypothetical protein [Aequorivita sp.]